MPNKDDGISKAEAKDTVKVYMKWETAEIEKKRLDTQTRGNTDVCQVYKCWDDMFTICTKCDMKLCWAHGGNTPWGACRCTPRRSDYTVPHVKDQELTSRAKAFNKVDCASKVRTADATANSKLSAARPPDGSREETKERTLSVPTSTGKRRLNRTGTVGMEESTTLPPSIMGRGGEQQLELLHVEQDKHDTYIGPTPSRTHDVGGPTHTRTHTNTTDSACTERKSVARPTAADFFDFQGKVMGEHPITNVSGGRPLTLTSEGQTPSDPLVIDQDEGELDVSGGRPLTLNLRGRPPRIPSA